MWLGLFKIAALVTLVVFVRRSFDLRKKHGMTPLAPPTLTRIMMIVSSTVVAFYAYVLWALQVLVSTDALGLALTVAGAALVRAAKLELGVNHTWTGSCIESPRLVRSGVYGYLRHPLYAGVYLFEIGAMCIFAPRLSVLPRWVAGIAVGGLGYAMIFNAVMATRETRRMTAVLGTEFERYCACVPAFIPRRRRVFGKEAIADGARVSSTAYPIARGAWPRATTSSAGRRPRSRA